MTMVQNAAARAEVLRTRDLIGWAVADPAGATVGTVSDLLIGRDGRVRYLAVKRGLLGSSVLIPVDELDWGEQSMRLTRWLDADVRRLPPYDAAGPLSAELVEEMGRAHPRFYGPPLHFDAAGVEGQSQVVPLRDAREFRLPKDAPNPKGWEVFGADNERVGVVEGMLVDPDQMRVRYLDVDVADDLFHLREDRHVVVPMEFVELRERGRDVWVKGMAAHEIALLPAYTGGPLDPLVEQRVEQAFQRRPEPNALPPSHRASAPREDTTVDLPPHDSRVDLPPPANYRDEEHPAHRADLPPPLSPRHEADY
ncbi:MAG TPA: PRC-barrel domain-containing protein [Longimicrobium sp.]|jgi:sporulation protein YlmC with PRC-barrel domain|nr:PRC-barrel domain-containing protein [Longimicrobium sp.]